MISLAKYGEKKFGEGLYGAERTLTAIVTSSATMTKNSLFYKTLTCIVSAGATMQKTVSKTLDCTVLTIGSIQKSISKTLSATVNTSGSLVRLIAKNLTTTVISSGNMQKMFYKNLTAIVKSSGSIQKTISKTLTAVVKSSGTIRRMMANFKQLFPDLTYTEYPIEMTVTEYPIIMEVVGVPKAGSTITLRGEFPDSAGILSLLADVTVKIYGPGKTLLSTLTPAEVSIGIYSTEYTIPETIWGQFDYEFSGVIGSKTIEDRSSFDSNWK